MNNILRKKDEDIYCKPIENKVTPIIPFLTSNNGPKPLAIHFIKIVTKNTKPNPIKSVPITMLLSSENLLT